MTKVHLERVIGAILAKRTHFLSGLHESCASPTDLLSAVVELAAVQGRDFADVAAVIEPCIRQSILMSLLPAAAFDADYEGTIDNAIDGHVKALGWRLSDESLRTLRDICINVRRVRELTSQAARVRAAGIAKLRGMPRQYALVRERQAGRCAWCGVSFDGEDAIETLDHVAPKHIGDDPSDASNWALACKSCNEGKADALVWAAQPTAHDYFGRAHFRSVDTISLSHRASVLLRSKACEFCRRGPSDGELMVYKRVPTGLPIPANCGLICDGKCLGERKAVPLNVAWAQGEGGRARAR